MLGVRPRVVAVVVAVLLSLVVPATANAKTTLLRRLPVISSHVALYWVGHPDAVVRVAFSRDGKHFGRYVDAGRDELGEQRSDGRTYGAVLVAPKVTALRIISNEPIKRLNVFSLPDHPLRWLGKKILPKDKPGDGKVARPPITSRAEWGADESLRYTNGKEDWPPKFAPVQKLIVHHTAGTNNDPNPAATIRAIYRYHALTQHWGDIGYNFLIDQSGRIYKGRNSHAPGSDADTITGDNPAGEGVIGAHARNYNSGSVGVALLGTLTERDATPAAKRALEDLLAWEADAHNIDPHGATTYPNIAGHRDVGDTACPGGAFYATLPQVRDAVAARMR